MGRLRELVEAPPDSEVQSGQQLFEARVFNTPATKADDVFVEIPDFDGGKHKFQVNWRPAMVLVSGNPVEKLPKENDHCVVSKSSPTSPVWLLEWSTSIV